MNPIPHNPSKDFDALLDVCCQESAIETIGDWASCPEAAYQESWAKTIENLLVTPLYWWIGQQKDAKPGRVDIAAARELAEYAWMDIAYGLMQRQKLWPEHVSKLDALWKEFQRQVGWGAILDTEHRQKRVVKTASAGGRGRWKTKDLPTKITLEKFREDFYAKEGKFRGWKKVACIQFSIDIKTLNKII